MPEGTGEENTEEMVGVVLDARYRIVRRVGEGAMGQVYLAQNGPLGRREAIKVLQAAAAVDPHFVSRFRREARASNRLQHANIVSLYDFGRLPDGRMFLAMEYADGPRLDQILCGIGYLPVERALRVASQLALAIDHAHARGVIHRDLKPSNVILVAHKGQRDVVKVLDFGMAKIVAPEYSEMIAVTANGEVFGTPAYMAPEQFHGEGDDPRIDIYAFGCMLFEMLTGEPPFAGHNLELMQAHTRQEPERPSERQPEANIPPALDDVVDRCLLKDPHFRFRTGAEIRRALDRIARAEGWQPAPDSCPLAPLPEFGDDNGASTDSHSFSDKLTEAIATDDTQVLAEAELQACLEEALLELAEGLLDMGATDSQVTVCVARLHALADDVLRTEINGTELRLREGKVEQARREREGSLRFAIGELKFDREQASEKLKPDLDIQLEGLEKRLAALLETSRQQLDAITEDEITMAAERGVLRDRCADQFAKLERLIEAIIPQYEDDLELAPLIDRYQSIQERVRRLPTGPS